MEKTPETPTLSSTASPEDLKDPERKGWRISVGYALAAAAILSTLATIEANGPEKKLQDKPTTISAELPNGHIIESGVSAGMQDVVPMDGEFKLPGIDASFVYKGAETKPETETVLQPETVETIEESMGIETNVQLINWAQKFDVDPVVINPRGPEAITSTAEQIKDLEADGWSVEKVTLAGSASDEDDGEKRAGLGFDNEKNTKLAEKRAGVVKGLLFEELEKTLGEDGARNIEGLITVKDGIETRDPDLNARIVNMADTLGMSTESLVKTLNRDPDSLPKNAQSLGLELAGDRFVTIEIELTRQIPIEQTIESTENIDTVEEKKEESKFVLVLIPVPPIPRRRREGKSQTTTPPTITPPIMTTPLIDTPTTNRPPFDLFPPSVEMPPLRAPEIPYYERTYPDVLPITIRNPRELELEPEPEDPHTKEHAKKRIGMAEDPHYARPADKLQQYGTHSGPDRSGPRREGDRKPNRRGNR